MVILLPKSSILKKDDVIALTNNDIFIGYGTVFDILDELVLVKIDKKTSKLFNELFGEDIPFSFSWG
ncbi:MAG: hypothetical protein ACYDG2_09545 [Ruminiclostridium sp.]